MAMKPILTGPSRQKAITDSENYDLLIRRYYSNLSNARGSSDPVKPLKPGNYLDEDARAGPKPAAPPKAPAKVTPLPALTGPVTAAVAAPAAPAPMGSPIGQTAEALAPERQALAQAVAPIPVPTLDDAAARVNAQQPMATPGANALDPLSIDPKRKKYGIGATTLTGEGGIQKLGSIATRTLLG